MKESRFLLNIILYLWVLSHLKITYLNDSVKYGISNSLVGIAIGLHTTTRNDSYYLFIYILPISFFITSVLFWKLFVDGRILKVESKRNKVVFTGFLTGFISHPISFIVLYIIGNIAYWLPFIDNYNIIDSPVNLINMLISSFILSIFSLIMYGWITIPSAIILGILLDKLSKRTTKQTL